MPEPDLRALTDAFAACGGEGLSPEARKQFDDKRRFFCAPETARLVWDGVARPLGFPEFAGRRVLDAGCGTGYVCVYAAAAGAEVVGVDLNADRLAVFRRFLNCAPEPVRKRIRIREERIEAVEGEEPFDFILCNESISHIVDDDLFGRFHGMLAPGGALYISDGNNLRCRAYRDDIHRFWQRLENGPVGVHESRYRNRPVPETFVQIRRRLLAARFAGRIGDDDLDRIARETAGLHGEALARAGAAFLESGRTPGRMYRYGEAVIHPESGVYCEQLFDPVALAGTLRAAGFTQVRLFGPEGHSRGGWVRWALRLLPLRAKFFLQPSFKIVARR